MSKATSEENRKAAKLHAPRPQFPHVPLCSHGEGRLQAPVITADRAKVTCGHCLRAMRGAK